MGIIEILLIGVGLAMDAFAVSICKGLAMPRLKTSSACVVGLWFGAFQALMPVIGWLLGSRFEMYITSFDHWIAFALLLLIGGNMIRESLGKEEECPDASLAIRTMLLLAIATSIDALAVGVTFAFFEVNILLAASVIGGVTFLISVAGVVIGHAFGARFQKKAEFVGGAILIGIGIKILVEHLLG